MRQRKYLVVSSLALLWWASSTCYTVEPSEFVYVTQFGRHAAIHDGDTQAGLHWKLPWPVQAVQRLDRRLQVFDLSGAELLTHDPQGNTIDKTLTIDAFVCWRIADAVGVDAFVRTVGTFDRARLILDQRVKSHLGAVVSKMRLDELVGVATPAAAAERAQRLRDRLMGRDDANAGLCSLIRDAYGIDIVDVGLRRCNYPYQVRNAIFERIKSERNRKVEEYRSDGAKLAEDVKSAANREARFLLAEAKARAQRLMAEAETRADEIRNQAHAQDRDFYAFLQKLKTYRQILSESKDVLLLSSKHEIFDLLLKPPSQLQPILPSSSPGDASRPKSPNTGLGRVGIANDRPTERRR